MAVTGFRFVRSALATHPDRQTANRWYSSISEARIVGLDDQSPTPASSIFRGIIEIKRPKNRSKISNKGEFLILVRLVQLPNQLDNTYIYRIAEP